MPTTSGFEELSSSALKKLRAFGVMDTAAFRGMNLCFTFRRLGGSVEANGDVFFPPEEDEKDPH